MFNGYSDIAEQIAASHGVVLSSAAGNSNKNVILVFKFIFFGMILYAIFRYLKIVIKNRREKNEQQR
jgi:hypothetical protein